MMGAARRRRRREPRPDPARRNALERATAAAAQPPAREDLRGLVSDAWRAAIARSPARSIQLVCEMPDALTAAVDRGGIRQLLARLFDHAVRATRAGGCIWVRANRVAGVIALTITDGGSGRPRKDLLRDAHLLVPGGLPQADRGGPADVPGARILARGVAGVGTAYCLTLPAGSSSGRRRPAAPRK
jgi:hypothetical protein